ncbi:hypothetical protein FACS189461_2540 [Spirochaetia bacterium]|nr:hypothetical protein FACS189461_2540 [Spirochaetia bacterium]
MKHSLKLILLLLFILFSAKAAQATGQHQKFIKINYAHSLRILHQNIIIELFTDTQNSEIYKMKIETRAMAHSEYYSEMNINEVVNIEREYFENIYNRLFEINIKRIIEEAAPRGPVADGSSVNIQFGINPGFISIGIGDPGRMSGEIGKVDQIIKEIFETAALLDYYE